MMPHMALYSLFVLTACAACGKELRAGPGSNVDTNGGTPAAQLPSDLSLCPAMFRSQLPAGQHWAFLSGGQSRSFALLLPSSSFTGPRPLVFAFHGTDMKGADAISSYGLQQWVSAGSIVVAPDSNGNGTVWPVWDSFALPTSAPQANADLALFDDLLLCVAAHHAVDAKRLYVLGHSAGGAMTNFILGRRSSLLAGGIAASGAFDLTQMNPPGPIDPLAVIVSWGGSNDIYTAASGGAPIANIAYAEQAALASQFWKGQPGTLQVACQGHDLGHHWLSPINEWMRDILLAHPKGAALTPGWSLPPLASGVPVSCSEDTATYQSPITVSCSDSSTGCQSYCQLLGDCLVENGSLGPIAAQQLLALGFSSSGNVCSGCTATCVSDAFGSSDDAVVLQCLSTSAPSTTCGPGFAGSAVFATVGACCNATPASRLCARFCATFRQNPLLAPVLTGCP